ncbi:MAG: hypothetical protein IJ763_09165 [Lachnospiraceae bacterium]|nr:hypothetical protein [Lachnospiraceae bacterium]
MFKNKRILVVVILYILLVLWVMFGCLNAVGVRIFTGINTIDNFFVDSSDFTSTMNFDGFIFGQSAHFFVMCMIWAFTCLGACVLAVICRYVVLKRDTTSSENIKKCIKIIFFMALAAYIICCILSSFTTILFMLLTFIWIPLSLYKIYHPFKEKDIDS